MEDINRIGKWKPFRRGYDNISIEPQKVIVYLEMLRYNRNTFFLDSEEVITKYGHRFLDN